jgi:hypothetical protein
MTKLNILVVVLTMLSYWSILSIVRKIHKKSFSVVIGSQSDIHALTKVMFSQKKNTEKVSQLTKHEAKNRIDVLVVENKAYWVSNNVFYSGDIVDGAIDHETTSPIDIINMKKEEVDKMLFIMDSLKNGNKDDNSGTRH